MTLKEALNQLTDTDPYLDRYAWLYLTCQGSPAKARFYLVRARADGAWEHAWIGIYDDSMEALQYTVFWLLHHSAAEWCHSQSMHQDAADSCDWGYDPAFDMVRKIKELHPCQC